MTTRKGGFPVRWFKASDGTILEGSLLNTAPHGWRWRLCKMSDSSGLAFGQVSRDSVKVNRELTQFAALLGLAEITLEEVTPDA